MGNEAEARALAAGEIIEVNGQEYKLRPLAAQLLCDLEREALRFYKRQYLETYVDNADLLRGDVSKDLIEKKMDLVASWDLTSLPQKDAYDVSRVPVTEELKAWASDRGEDVTTDNQVRAVVAVALENGQLDPKQVKDMAGRAPLHGKVRYDQWWVTATMAGMASFITASLSQDGVDKRTVYTWPFAKIAEAARMVEHLTAASLGNG